MDLSIICPCHNLENYITPLLVSLKLQSFIDRKVELIFICDACTDNTEKIIKSFDFGNRYTNISVYTCDYHSCGLARNLGLEKSTGKAIWFVDGDDWLTDPFAIKTITDIFDDAEVNLLKIDYTCPTTFKFKGYFSMVWQYIYRRSAIGDIRFINIQPDEDVDFNNKIFDKFTKENIKLHQIDQVLYHYNYLRTGSNMQTFFEKGKIK